MGTKSFFFFGEKMDGKVIRFGGSGVSRIERLNCLEIIIDFFFVNL